MYVYICMQVGSCGKAVVTCADGDDKSLLKAPVEILAAV